MLKNLIGDVSLRGYSFEYISRILLRREKKNNFIFQLTRFDNVEEIIKKYRLNTSKLKNFQKLLSQPIRCDLIEFKLNNNKERIVEEISFYDVKTRKNESERKYFETCLSNAKFMKKASDLGFKTFCISIITFEDWRFSFNIYPYKKVYLRVYNSVSKKTIYSGFSFDPDLANSKYL